MGKKKKTTQDYYGLARRRGFEWIGNKLPKNVEEKTLWRCSRGHEWAAYYSSVQQGSGCPYCVGTTKTAQDYHEVGKDRNIEWVGKELPRYVLMKTPWKCSGGHEWETTYSCIQQGSGCHRCVDMVNGRRVSKPQKQLCKVLDGELNYPCDSYRIDVALPDKMIAIEYDSWYWHGHKQDYAKRDASLLAGGWKVLHIKANTGMPTKRELDRAITRLENGEKVAEIVLDDWGKGPTFAEVRTRFHQ